MAARDRLRAGKRATAQNPENSGRRSMVIGAFWLYAGLIMRKLIAFLACGYCAVTASAQDDVFQRNHITVGSCPAILVGNRTSYFSTAPLTLGFEYHVMRLFQLDAGFQIVVGAANNQNVETTDFGHVQASDHEYIIPRDRYIISSRFKTMKYSAGGGAVSLRYAEPAPSSEYYYSGTYTYTSSEDWAGYGLGTASYFFGEHHILHVGTTFEFVSASTNDPAVGNGPTLNTTDHFSNLYIEFGFRF